MSQSGITAAGAAAPGKETAAQRIERVKRDRAPWSILDDIRRYALEGFGSIPDDDLSIRLRAWGLYTQGDGHGTRGEAVPYFMMRVRTPNGALTSTQVRTIAELADKYCRGTIDITNRQNFQLHWLRIEDVPAVWDTLASVGWTSMGACGDNTRTVTGCPLAGVDAHELINAQPLADSVDRALNGNPEYANLPRKFKITVTGCSHWCTYPEINDVGFTAARRGDLAGFNVRVGGGLSTRPHFAVPLDAFVLPGEVVEVAMAIAGIFRDSEELRVNRAKARMKFLFLNHGWTSAKFRDELERRLGHPIDRAVEHTTPDGSVRDHVGIHAQRQRGLNYAGFSISSGRITTNQLRSVAGMAEEYGDGSIRATPMQNLVVLNVDDANLDSFRTAAESAGLPLTGSTFQRGTVSCTGSEFCKLALTETKRFSIQLARELERRMPGFAERLRVNVTGCPNACGQHWISDIGLQGVLMSRNGEQTEGFDVFCGGGLGLDARFARRLGFRVTAAEAPDALERLYRQFESSRAPEQTFRDWSARVGDDKIVRVLSGNRTSPAANSDQPGISAKFEI